MEYDRWKEDNFMLILACQKCGELKVLAGSPDSTGAARAVWTCKKCGAGQLLELTVSKDAKRGDLRKIIGGLALSSNKLKKGCQYMREGLPDERRS